ncbi:MAG: hypothetical protein WCJ81_07140 [bacterium]
MRRFDLVLLHLFNSDQAALTSPLKLHQRIHPLVPFSIISTALSKDICPFFNVANNCLGQPTPSKNLFLSAHAGPYIFHHNLFTAHTPGVSILFGIETANAAVFKRNFHAPHATPYLLHKYIPYHIHASKGKADKKNAHLLESP